MMTEILQNLNTLYAELSAIDPAQDCNAAQTVADIARDLQRLVASASDHSVDLYSSKVSSRNAA